MTSTLTIDGASIQGDIVAMGGAYAAAMEIVASGKPRSLVFEGVSGTSRVKTVFFVTATSAVSVELVDEPGVIGADKVYGAFTPNAESIVTDANERFFEAQDS
jgi:hypothetical protein